MWRLILTEVPSTLRMLMRLIIRLVRGRRKMPVLPTFSGNTTVDIVLGANTPGDARAADLDGEGIPAQQLRSLIEIYSGQATVYAGEDRSNEFLYRFYLPPTIVVESRRTSIPESDWLFLPSRDVDGWQFEIKGVHYIYDGDTLYLQYVVAKLVTRLS